MSRLVYIIAVFFILCSCRKDTRENVQNKPSSLTTLAGPVFGTSYNIIYESKEDFQKEIDSLYYQLNRSLSTYQTNSDISKVNRNEIITIDAYFEEVFIESKVIYAETNGAFDPTIGAVVNAWDFGPEGKIVDIDSLKIDSLMVDVGFDKVTLTNKSIYKPKNSFLDFNAIAKGYGVDIIARFLDAMRVENYLIEIGGEIRAKGKNTDKDTHWTVGIEAPNFDGERSVIKAISLNSESMATSGVYRKFKVDENGDRYSHIIDTATGFPSKTNILSVTVIAESCMVADGYATAFKSLGIDRTKRLLETHPELKVFVIFENEDGQIETQSMNGFPN